MRITRHAVAVAGVCAVLLASGRARAETSICTVVASVPVTISQPGAYCFDRDLATTGGGIAIDIAANDVQLDLNGFTLENTTGNATTGIGIYSDLLWYRKNIVVRNGVVKGFRTGVQLMGAGGLQVEGIRALENKQYGIYVKAAGSVVRGNVVAQTTGTTTVANASTYGLRIDDAGARVVDNDVVDTLGVGSGIGYGIYGNGAYRSFYENNRVGLSGSVLTNAKGIYLSGTSDAQVINNRVTALAVGIEYGPGSSGKYRDNVALACTTGYVGGTNVGNNQ